MHSTTQLQLYTPPDEATYASLRDIYPEASPTWERATRWELTPDGYEDDDEESPIYELLSDSAMARCGVNPYEPPPSHILSSSPRHHHPKLFLWIHNKTQSTVSNLWLPHTHCRYRQGVIPPNEAQRRAIGAQALERAMAEAVQTLQVHFVFVFFFWPVGRFEKRFTAM